MDIAISIKKIRLELAAKGLLDYMDVAVIIGKEGPEIVIHALGNKLAEASDDILLEILRTASDIHSRLVKSGWPVRL